MRAHARAPHAPRPTATRSSTTTTSPTSSTRSGSTRAWSTRARTSGARTTTLEPAQVHKLDHICRKLRLAPGDRFLDIGCGWGALVDARGARTTASTPPASRSPRTSTALATRAHPRGGPAGPLPRAAPGLPRPPRRGAYDKIASVGMFEHVGLREPAGLLRRGPAPAARARPLPEPRHHLVRHRTTAPWAWARANSSTATCSRKRRAAAPAPRRARA